MQRLLVSKRTNDFLGSAAVGESNTPIRLPLPARRPASNGSGRSNKWVGSGTGGHGRMAVASLNCNVLCSPLHRHARRRGPAWEVS